MMKVKIKGGRAQISAGMNSPLMDYLAEAEERFLKDVESGVKKIVGTKVKTKVQRSRSSVWLEGEGVNLSDMDFSFMMNVVTKGDFDAVLFLEIRDVMRGKSDEKFNYKVGTLTVQEAVNVFKRYWG